MNKVILMGRVTRDIEVKYSTGENQMAIARYTLAVPRRFKREGEADVDFIGCVVFGKNAEFAEKYFRQGTKIVVCGRIQTGSYTNRDGQKVYTTDVIVEEQDFAESKNASEVSKNQDSGGRYTQPGGQNKNTVQETERNSYKQNSFQTDKNGFMNVSDGTDEELPFH